MAGRICLRGVNGESGGLFWDSGETQPGTLYRVGRLPDLEVVLDNQWVSRRHAEIRFGAEGWSLHDVGSRNGTFVNEARLGDHGRLLRLHDLVRFAGVYLVVELLEPEAASQGRDEDRLIWNPQATFPPTRSHYLHPPLRGTGLEPGVEPRMGEDEWSACDDPLTMLRFLHGRASNRKLRLFACSCCGEFWDLVRDATRQAVAAEEYELGLALPGEAWEPPAYAQAAADEACAAALAGQAFVPRRGLPPVALLRDLFGPLPFRPVSFPPACLTWNNGAVPHLARAIYGGGRFEELPVLADALEEAGCPPGELLDHLHSSGPHARGCWALDLILGES
jgi:pSer/pThr/pTyr-binding forkhead associated (FHA) protein